MDSIQEEFEKLLSDGEGIALIVFNMAQEFVQEEQPKSKEAQALNIIVGSSFALLHAIRNYKEIKNGKSNDNSVRTSHSEDRSRLS